MEHIDTEKMKHRLEEERAQLEKELETHGGSTENKGDWTGSSATIETGSADPNVVADQIEELVTNVGLVETLEIRYRNIVRALKKIEDGTYGICEVGNEQIPVERLEANPAARTCVAHADKEKDLPA